MHDVRRLAPASIEVMQRHADKSAIAAHTPTMVPLASEVLTAITESDTLKGKQVALLAESAEQTALLNGLMIGWSGILDRDLVSFDIGTYVRNSTKAFDVVQKAISYRHFVELEGAGLPYQATLLAELTARIESADGAAKRASGARVELQEKQRRVRELTATFHKRLISLRRALRAMLGSNHFDYQRLRRPKAAATAEPPSDAAPDATSTVPSTTGGEPTSRAPMPERSSHARESSVSYGRGDSRALAGGIRSQGRHGRQLVRGSPAGVDAADSRSDHGERTHHRRRRGSVDAGG